MTTNSWWRDLGELDDEQADVISLPKQGDFLVVGPPGSGKTNLLLLRASYLVNSQLPNVVVLMFTRSLREFVVRGSGTYAFADDKVQTIMRWEQRLIRENGGQVPQDMPFAELRKEHAVRLATIFDQKPLLEHHLDCILVDEVQDCLPEEIALFRRAAAHVFFVGDHRQQIYEKNGLLETLKGTMKTVALTKHYRNGEAICKVADAVGKTSGEVPLFPSCNYDETKAKSSANFDACKDESEMIQKLSARLVAQLKAYPGELLGIACAKNDDVSRVRTALASDSLLAPYLLPDGQLADDSDPERRIYICSMHDAKGLEFRAMHLPFAEKVVRMGDIQKRLAFTSITRAKTALSIYHVKALPGYLESGREKVSQPKSPVNVKDLFPGKKI